MRCACATWQVLQPAKEKQASQELGQKMGVRKIEDTIDAAR